SVGRADLNRVLIEEAARHAGVEVRFSQLCLGADAPRDRLRLRDEASGAEREIALTPTIATDGAGSALRGSLATAGLLSVREDWLDHDYRELSVPPVAAAHALVPFHGQGMNAAFEDCTVLDELIEHRAEWEAVFGEFERLRRPNTEAIAQMALENYGEMRDAVLDADFLRRRQIALGLERRFPDRFIPRYSMVMFHPEIPYAEALRRGAVQAQLLDELDRGPGVEPDARLAEKLVRERLPPIG